MNLSKLDFSKIDFKNSKVRSIAVIVIIGIAGAVAWHQMMYVDLQAQVQKLHEDRQAKQNELNNILAMKPQLNKLRKDIEMAQVRLDSLKSIFPDQKEIPRLIQEITRLARSTEIVTVRFSPLPDIEKEYYVENRYNVTVSGEYHRLGDFYSKLANLQLLVNLSDVALTAHPEVNANTSEEGLFEKSVPSVMASFKMTTFSSKR